MFDAIFKGYFQSLTNSESFYELSIGGNAKTYNRKKILKSIYNKGECQTLITKSFA